ALHLSLYELPAPTENYTLSLHDALPIWFPANFIGKPAKKNKKTGSGQQRGTDDVIGLVEIDVTHLLQKRKGIKLPGVPDYTLSRSEEHTSELQSRENLVCRLLLEKKKQK